MSKSHWSSDAEIAHVKAQIVALEKLVDERRQVVNDAIRDVEDNIIRTAAQQNEWRKALNDLMGTRMGREEYRAAHEALTVKFDGLSKAFDRHEGGSKGVGSSWLVAVQIFMVVGIVCAIITELVLH